MKLQTKYHGVQEVTEEEIIYFENGLPGFIDEKHFTILPLDEDSPFLILQSTQTAELAFVIAVPFDFYQDYDIRLTEDTLKQLNITNEKGVALFSILTIHDDFNQSTINLKAPLIVNSTQQIGKQVVLNEHMYETRAPLFYKGNLLKKEGS